MRRVIFAMLPSRLLSRITCLLPYIFQANNDVSARIDYMYFLSYCITPLLHDSHNSDMAESEHTKLLDLPIDILLLIFPYLDAPSFLSLTATCRALHSTEILHDRYVALRAMLDFMTLFGPRGIAGGRHRAFLLTCSTAASSGPTSFAATFVYRTNR